MQILSQIHGMFTALFWVIGIIAFLVFFLSVLGAVLNSGKSGKS